jgi:hypothetical protein
MDAAVNPEGETGNPAADKRSGQGWSGWLKLWLGVAVLLVLWSHGWRCLDAWPWFRAHQAVVAREKIRVGALFYTELEAYPGKLSP